MRAQGRTPRKSAKQVITDLAMQLIRARDMRKEKGLYTAPEFTAQLYTIQLICARIGWADLCRRIDRAHDEYEDETTNVARAETKKLWGDNDAKD